VKRSSTRTTSSGSLLTPSNPGPLEVLITDFRQLRERTPEHFSFQTIGNIRAVSPGNHCDSPQAVTERSNAATEERLKTGHAVGGMSIV
jgi:hypothetical protein